MTYCGLFLPFPHLANGDNISICGDTTKQAYLQLLLWEIIKVLLEVSGQASWVVRHPILRAQVPKYDNWDEVAASDQKFAKLTLP
jgi:hypothetical protein